MELPKEARDAIKKTYRAMDENGDGRVSVAEVRRASKRIGIEFSMDQIKQMMGELDDNGDGYINYPEFERMITTFIQEDSEEINAARKIFRSMDVDGDGKVTVPEIVSSLKVSKAEAKELMEEADTDNDGKMSFEEFLNVYRGQTG
ncbi:calmodulin [Mytilus galloprovincialis]|uniref:Calmodulin n=1 Tax=Mytilus galloprovincialis TaxID=29158 RepID=A0A8B6HCD1_MYTGA|nr:calmodulin [Mytilus galloprovincialis]